MFPRAWSCYLQRLLRICYVIFLFQLPFALWYARLKLSYKFLQILIRGTGVADYYNIILLRLNLEVHVFHFARGGRLVALVGVCIVWNSEPLASGGQSSHKLIPHIICQFVCTLKMYLMYPEKLWTRTYSTRDQVPTCHVFTRAKIKSRFGILKNLPSHFILVPQSLFFSRMNGFCFLLEVSGNCYTLDYIILFLFLFFS